MYIGSQSGSTVMTVPTETQRSRTQTQSRSYLQTTSVDDIGQAGQEEEETKDNSWGAMLAALYPVIKIMQVQVNLIHISKY